jgi:hypothetical protein
MQLTLDRQQSVVDLARADHGVADRPGDEQL